MKLQYETYGYQNNPPLALIHGWGLCGKIFTPIIPILSKDFHLYVIDLPGYGVNHNIPSNHTESILNSLNDTIPKNINILGWSLGGMLATEYASFYPSCINKLITVCASPKFIEDTNWKAFDRELIITLINAINENNHKKIIEKFLTIQSIGSPSIKNDIKLIKQLISQMPETKYYELQYGLKLLLDMDLRAYTDRITCPSLHVYGAKDRLVPILNSNCWPHKDDTLIYTFKESSHAPFISETELFCKIIKKFILYT